MDRRQTTELKGLAIMLMFWHHLFGCGKFLVLEANQWTSLFGPADAIFGGRAKICIALFSAASGYGLLKSYIRTNGSEYIYIYSGG